MTIPIGKIFTSDLKNDFEPSNYPKNWTQISKDFRKERRYKCEKCGVDCSEHPELVDAHHKNGDKSDCNYGNLVCLCKHCHSKEDHHGHYQNQVKKNIPKLQQLWKEQEIDIEKI